MRCCRYEFPLKNIYMIHLMIAIATTTCLLVWIFSQTNTKYSFEWAYTLWVYLSLVVVQFLLRIHFKYYNSHLKRLRSVQWVGNKK